MKKNKLIFTIILMVATLFSCAKKENLNDITAKKLKGEWTATSITVDGTETVYSGVFGAKTTFFDIVANKGRYNAKVYVLNNLNSEKEGNFTVSGNGTKLTLDEDGSQGPETVNIDELTESLLKTSGTSDGKQIVYTGTK